MDGLTELFDAARAAQKRAYAPYSKFRVGAALRAASGAIYSGCNVENAAFPSGVCAETGAISQMILAGETKIVEMLVVSEGVTLVTPCGGCRQRINEFARPNTKIYSADPRGVKATYDFSNLLPHAFGPEHIDQNEDIAREPT